MAFNDFKNKEKSPSRNIFWYVKVCIFWKLIQYTVHWDKIKMLKKMSSKFLQESSSIINVWQNSKWDKVFMGKVNFFKDCLPQISFRPFLNTLSHLEFYQTSMMEELKNYRAFFVTFILFKRNFFNICVLSQIWCIE